MRYQTLAEHLIDIRSEGTIDKRNIKALVLDIKRLCVLKYRLQENNSLYMYMDVLLSI